MHQIGVVGLSYRHANVDEVARFAVPKGEVAARLPSLRDSLGVSEVFYVGTCNRVEVLYATLEGVPAGDARPAVFRALIGRDPEPGEANRVLRAWTGEAAVEHLFLLACGLDSAQTGEQEIAAQLRGAWESARVARTCGPTLDRVLSEALGMATRVHRIEAKQARAPSLGDMAAERVLRHLGQRPPPADKSIVALVGVSPMTRRCGAALHRAGIPLLVVNRTLQAAEELAKLFSGRALTLDEFRIRPPAVGAVVLAAGGGGRGLDAAPLANIAKARIGPVLGPGLEAGLRAGQAPPGLPSGGAPLLVDLALPPNADPEASRAL